MEFIFLGSIVLSLLLSINYYSADSETMTKEYEIIEKHTVKGPKYHRDERRPVFTILFEGKKLELKYDHKYLNKMDSYRTITLGTSEGFFGYKIIVNRTLNL